MRVENKVTYYQIYDLFISAEKNCLILAYYLLFRTRAFHLHVPAQRRYLRMFPGKIIKVLRVINLVIKLFRLKHATITTYNARSIPFAGHILLETGEGYKVFDLKNRVVVTKYRREYHGEPFRKIANNVSLLGKYGVSAPLKAIDYQTECIYEAYLNVYQAKNFAPFSEYFCDRILPIWERNIMRFPKRKVDVKTYIRNQEKFIIDSLHCCENKLNAVETVNYIRNYVGKLTAQLLETKDISDIDLCWTHGDMHYRNILLNRNGGMLIDCNTVKERSIYHDLFYMFFDRLFKEKVFRNYEGLAKFETYMENAAVLLQGKNDKTGTKAHVKKFYRRLFYLEYVVLAFENYINVSNDQVHVQEEMDFFHGNIEIFEDAEYSIEMKKQATTKFVKNNDLAILR